VLRSQRRACDVVAEWHGRRAVGAKGISCRVNESVLHREVQNLSRDSDTIDSCESRNPGVFINSSFRLRGELLLFRTSLYFTLRAGLWLFKIVPDDFVRPKLVKSLIPIQQS